MIDIHCHLLFGVDDGSDSIKESIAMLQEAKAQGIEDIILTPHYRHGMFPYDRKRIEAHFKELLFYAKEVGVRIYPGCEYHVNSRIIEYIRNGRCHTLADTNYVLTEYEYETEYSYIKKMTRELLFQGYIPVIAHVERYACMQQEVDRAGELQDMGALIQVNCDAVLGNDGRAAKKYTKKLIKEGYLDIIASDSHGIKKRVCHMRPCFEYVSKKYGNEVARELMEENPREILASRRRN